MNKQRLIAILLIIFLGFGCYFNTLSSSFVWDDTALVEENFLIKDSRYIGRIFLSDLFNLRSEGSNFYRPLQSLSYMLDYHLWKLNPLGYHLTNIILQIMVAILVYEFILIILSNTAISLITALLFVVHPVHVEAVTYISGRADMLLGIFLLLSLILFIRGFYLFSLASFVCALLSKELALIFPFLLILYVSGFKFPVSQKNPPRFYAYLSFFLASVIYLFLRFNIFPHKTILPLFNRNSLFSFKAPFLYLKTLLLPFNLHMSRTVVFPASILEPQVFLSLLGLILLFFLVFKSSTKAGKFKMFSFALTWFFLFLFPHLGIFKINAYFAEHFCYLASIGIFLIMAIIFVSLIKKSKIFIALLLSLVIFYSFLTVEYNFAWQDNEHLLKRILKLSQGSFAAYNNLGSIEEKRGNYSKAEEYYLKALNINPDFYRARLNLLRVIYLSGKEEVAISQLKDFIKDRPGSFWAWANLGSMYANRSQYPEAIEAYKQSLSINPSIPNHHYFLGLIYQEAGEFESAVKELNLAIGLDNKNYLYHTDLGLIYKNKGLYDLAVNEHMEALRLASQNPQVNINLGITYSLMGKVDQAERYLLAAVKLDNNYALAHYNLGIFYWQKKQFHQAKKEFETALRISPNFKQAKIWWDRVKLHSGP